MTVSAHEHVAVAVLALTNTGSEPWTRTAITPAALGSEPIRRRRSVVARTDLADNKYSGADPRVGSIKELVGKGETPCSLTFGAPSTTGPWLKVARDAAFVDDVEGALSSGKDLITASLAQQ